MRYRFGDYLFDTERYELHRAGVPVPLRPKECDVLAYLLTHRDRVVSKDELLEIVPAILPRPPVPPNPSPVCSFRAVVIVPPSSRRSDVSAIAMPATP
jgi:Transcriptional regulatory protein, C terminal